MKTDNTLAAKGGEAKKTRAEKAIHLLMTTAGDPFHQKMDQFREFYPAVVIAKRNGMTRKQIMKILAEAGLKIYPALFEKLVSAMAREADAKVCAHCGQAVIGQIGQHDAETSLDESRTCSVENI